MAFSSAARKAEWQRRYMPGYMAARRRLVRETPWDRQRYPVRKAWERAVLKCEQMRQYAIKHPHLVSRQLKHWDFDFQYCEALERASLKTIHCD
jgi:hypothetical protein